MVTFELVPHEGFGPIKLGMGRSVCRELLATVGYDLSHEDKQVDYFVESAISLEFDDENHLSFIGINANDSFTTQMYGVNAFDTPADELFTLLAGKEDPAVNPEDVELSAYLFRQQIVALWDADEQYDYLGNFKRKIWGQVAIGNSSYLAAIDAINAQFDA